MYKVQPGFYSKFGEMTFFIHFFNHIFFENYFELFCKEIHHFVHIKIVHYVPESSYRFLRVGRVINSMDIICRKAEQWGCLNFSRQLNLR